MSDDQFEAHVKTTAWYGVLSQAAKDDDDGASVFRMARMAANEAWQASRRTALEEAAQSVDSIRGSTQYGQGYARECMHKCADAIRTLTAAQSASGDA
jgi:hypothetical protein